MQPAPRRAAPSALALAYLQPHTDDNSVTKPMQMSKEILTNETLILIFKYMYYRTTEYNGFTAFYHKPTKAATLTAHTLIMITELNNTVEQLTDPFFWVESTIGSLETRTEKRPKAR